MAQSKLLGLPDLRAWRSAARSAGQTVVHCHGCFDIVHPGHIAHLQQARALGDLLVVTVSSDSNVNKGVSRPLIPEDLRAASLAALACVDAVYINPHPTAVELLADLQPDIYVKGREYETSQDPRFLAERDAVTASGGRVIFSSGDVIYSSTALITQLADPTSPLGATYSAEKLTRFLDRNDLTPSHLTNLLQRFRGQRVLIVGDYIQDRYHFCDPTAIASEGPMMTLRALASTDYDGGAAILARHLAAQNAIPTLITTLPDNSDTDHLRLRLSAENITLLPTFARKDTIIKERYLSETQKLFKVDRGQPASLDSTTITALAQTILTQAEQADAVILVDFGYGTLSAGLLALITEKLRDRPLILTGDISGKSPLLPHFHGFDLVTPTERELRDTLADHASAINTVAWRFLNTTRTKGLILTLGKQGLLAFNPQDSANSPKIENWKSEIGNPLPRLNAEHIPALTTHPIDVLGCGDALLATATLTLAAGGSLHAAAYLGSIAASLQAHRLGNTPISADDLLSRISRPLDRRIAV
jgi:rfaE bifunctional protein nucleotidyltransferase chain/domain